jgi:hypothetical protein
MIFQCLGDSILRYWETDLVEEGLVSGVWRLGFIYGLTCFFFF